MKYSSSVQSDNISIILFEKRWAFDLKKDFTSEGYWFFVDFLLSLNCQGKAMYCLLTFKMIKLLNVYNLGL